MKTDNYKNLCLAQALNSPLKYRHGCIVVKGGKVIGQGFNDFRNGFDGGSLKTGQLPLAAKSKNSLVSKSVVGTIAGMGGGPLANTPLTMHSEMMAINSALSSSSTLAATTVSSIKPCYKLPGDTKRKRELRRGAVAAFTDRVCRAELKQRAQRDTASVPESEWRQQQQQQNTPSAAIQNPIDGESDTEVSSGISSRTIVKKLEGPERKPRHHVTEPLENHMLLPKGRARAGGCNVRDRMKHPKLVGADLFVVRISAAKEGRKLEPSEHEKSKNPSGSLSGGSKDVSTGSLYDELKCKEPLRLTPATKEAEASHLCAGESRPCYRCVAYMNSVGIKRVFWTNESGNWECAKVVDLVRMLEGSMGGESDANIGVFVTKHEVLRLRKIFGELQP